MLEMNADYALWVVSVVAFFAFLPLFRQRKLYFVIAGVLLLAPCPVYYTRMVIAEPGSIWPAIACIPALFHSLTANVEGGAIVFYAMLLTVSVVAPIFWGLAYWAVPKK